MRWTRVGYGRGVGVASAVRVVSVAIQDVMIAHRVIQFGAIVVLVVALQHRRVQFLRFGRPVPRIGADELAGMNVGRSAVLT